MPESCVVDINFRTKKSKIKFDNDNHEYALTVNLGSYLYMNYEDSVFLIEFEFGELRFSISYSDMLDRMKNIGKLMKNSKEK